MHDDFPVGPTGEYPEGRISKDDGGELTVAIGPWCGHVGIRFGTEVAWLALTPDQARSFASNLIRHACALDGNPFIMEF